MIVNRITVLGNKDHGKSTLIGNLLIETGSVSEQRIDDAKKTSKRLGRKFEPGYILDSFQEEREREMTIDTTRAQVKYKNTGFEFIDVPGHEELMKNMLSGASYADFALLLVSAKPEEGITNQTKRHLFIAKMFGIDRLVVAVNKLDTVGYSRGRFEGIKREVSGYLDKIGFRKDNVVFVPISAYNAENLVRRSGKIRWYKGRNLIEALVKESEKKKGIVNKKLIIQIQGLFEGNERSVFGKVISGRLRKGQELVILPGQKKARVLAIFASGRRKSSAERGNVVTLELDKKVGKGVRGSVATDDKNSCRSGNRIHAMILATGQLKGVPSIRINGIEVECRKMVVSKAIDIATGECTASDRIKPLNAGSVELVLEREIATDAFDRTPEIGRFVLYINKNFSGIGIVRESA